MSIDYMPLNDVVREFCGYHNPPTETDFLTALEFLSGFSKRHKIKILKGPDMTELNKPVDIIIDEIRETWYKEDFKNFDYGYWFEMA